MLVRARQSSETPVTLLADLMSLAITKITPDQGGTGDDNHRWVTFDIDGASFKAGALVKHSRPGVFEIEPARWQVLDVTHIRAVFALRSALRGLYDVSVTNPDGKRVTEVNRYLVERSIEADFTTGIGGPRAVSPGGNFLYSVPLQSLTNIDTPYVRFDIGATEMGYSEYVLDKLHPSDVLFGSNLCIATSSRGVQVHVFAVNHVPHLTAGNHAVVIGQTLSIPVQRGGNATANSGAIVAMDNDGTTQTQALAISFTGLPEGASFDAQTQRLNWINPPAPAVFTYAAQATDADGDALRYSLTQAPTWATIDSLSGVVSWSTTVAGNYSFTVSVSDGKGGVTLQAFTLSVKAAGTATNTVSTAQVAIPAPSSASIVVNSSAVSAANADANSAVSYIVINSGDANSFMADAINDGALSVNWSGQAQPLTGATAGEQWASDFLGNAPDLRSLAEKTGLTVRVNG